MSSGIDQNFTHEQQLTTTHGFAAVFDKCSVIYPP